MSEPTVAPAAPPVRWTAFLGVLLLILVIYSCSIYANLALAKNWRDYTYFPPFEKHTNAAQQNRHLGAEYYNIAKAIVAGKGFANPFRDDTGPTAWMPPVLPAFLASLMWITDSDEDTVMAIVIFLQINALIATGVLVLLVTLKTTQRMGVLAAVALFLVAVIGDFRLWFQFTHDTWCVLLAMDILIAWLAFGNPLGRWYTAVLWGGFGGLCAMINPIVAMLWGVASLALMVRERAWCQFGIAVLLAAIVLTPWTIRNYLVFGRLIPVKSNAAYELWQSQCRQKDGLLRNFDGHPYVGPGPERREYRAVGEMAFVDKRRELFWQSFWHDPLDYADRVACRFLGATLWYVPFNLTDETRRPVMVWLSRAWHPLPFLALLVLGFSSIFQRLSWLQWLVMALYVLYLMPYVAVSYYERYGAPLLCIKMLLILWAGDRLLCLWPWWPWRAGDSSGSIEALPVEEEEGSEQRPVKKAVKAKPGEKP